MCVEEDDVCITSVKVCVLVVHSLSVVRVVNEWVLVVLISLLCPEIVGESEGVTVLTEDETGVVLENGPGVLASQELVGKHTRLEETIGVGRTVGRHC